MVNFFLLRGLQRKWYKLGYLAALSDIINGDSVYELKDKINAQ